MSKLNKPLTCTWQGKTIKYTFKELSGIPEAGNMGMDLTFEVGADKYHYWTDDGWTYQAEKNGEETPEDTEIGVHGDLVEDETIEMAASSLVQEYLRACGIADEQIDAYFALEGGSIENGEFKPD